MSILQAPGPGEPLVDSYTVTISSTDGQQPCGYQTMGRDATFVVLNVTGCVVCQGFSRSYDITVVASNRYQETTANTSLCKIILTYYTTYHGGVIMQSLCTYIFLSS